MAWSDAKSGFADLPVRDIPLHLVQERLTSPIPQPRQIFAVAANYPSHLFIDLSLPHKSGLIARLRQARPRVFQKYPPVAAPGDSLSGQEAYADLPGPFGPINAPPQIRIPTLKGENQNVPGHFDYEAEIAVMIGRDLSWDVVKTMSDAELRQAVAGYLLFSDAKVRDPQAMGKILQVFREEKSAPSNPYRVSEAALDGTLGIWDETTCHWWSYAASWGHYATYGPLLVASGGDTFPPRMILSGRSYSSAAERSVPPPQEVPQDQLLLRQAAVTTLAEDYPDALIWDIPTILRSLLDPAENALAFTGEAPVLYAGDLVSLGTPGGTVISAKPWWLLPFAENLLFWKTPVDFYRMFFAPTEGDYLYPGDELFLWGEGLGYQLLRIEKPREP
jgi:2-keto-4-pentenoate hydratase/2-oxohepta-3-ene-1,7-dioic acid hydratase in catechol pathway